MISPETRMMGLPYGEEIMIVGRTMWTQSTSVTDGQTDRQTDGRTDRITITKTVQRIASHGKNLHAISFLHSENSILRLPLKSFHPPLQSVDRSFVATRDRVRRRSCGSLRVDAGVGRRLLGVDFLLAKQAQCGSSY